MIVDVHYHLIPSFPDEQIDDSLSDYVRFAAMMGRKVDIEELRQRARATWSDPDGQKLLTAMDEAGVDVTLVCAVDPGPGVVPSHVAQLQNQMVSEVARKHPERAMALAGVDPRRPEAADMLRECVEEFGMKGLKYHADNDGGFDPSGPESYRLLEILEGIEGILLSHTGPLPPPARVKYAEPLLLADIGVDFPRVKVIAAHMGYINWRQWAALAAHQPNLYGDLAMWDVLALGRYELFCRELRDLIDFVGVEKVLFGTDDPIFRIIRPTKTWIQLLRDLPNKSPSGIEFAEEEVEAILGGSAASLLGL